MTTSSIALWHSLGINTPCGVVLGKLVCVYHSRRSGIVIGNQILNKFLQLVLWLASHCHPPLHRRQKPTQLSLNSMWCYYTLGSALSLFLLRLCSYLFQEASSVVGATKEWSSQSSSGVDKIKFWRKSSSLANELCRVIGSWNLEYPVICIYIYLAYYGLCAHIFIRIGREGDLLHKFIRRTLTENLEGNNKTEACGRKLL